MTAINSRILSQSEPCAIKSLIEVPCPEGLCAVSRTDSTLSLICCWLKLKCVYLRKIRRTITGGLIMAGAIVQQQKRKKVQRHRAEAERRVNKWSKSKKEEKIGSLQGNVSVGRGWEYYYRGFANGRVGDCIGERNLFLFTDGRTDGRWWRGRE